VFEGCEKDQEKIEGRKGREIRECREQQGDNKNMRPL